MNYSTEITNAFLAGQRGKALNAFIGGLNGDASRLLIIRKPAVVHEAYSICLELQKMEPRNPTSRAPLFKQTFNQTYQNYRLPNSPRFPQTYQINNRAQTSSGHNFAPSGSVQGSPRFQGGRPAIKQESNQSGQGYRTNFNSRQGEAGGIKRSPSANSNLNPFRKAQRLYHIQSTPSSNPTPNEYHERHPNNEVEELEVSS